MRLLIAVLGMAFVLFAGTSTVAKAADYCLAGQDPKFVSGFAELKVLLAATMGDPIECEHSNPENSDTLQQTTTGLAYYRSATNTPSFTNGPEHWALTATGLVYWLGDSVDPPGTLVASGATLGASSNDPVLTTADLVASRRSSVLRVQASEGCGSEFLVSSEGMPSPTSMLRDRPLRLL